MDSDNKVGSRYAVWLIPVIPLVVPMVLFIITNGLLSEWQLYASITSVVVSLLVILLLVEIPRSRARKRRRKARRFLSRVAGLIGVDDVKSMDNDTLSQIILLSYGTTGRIASLRIRSFKNLDTGLLEELRGKADRILLHGRRSGSFVIDASETTKKEVLFTRVDALDKKLDDITHHVLALREGLKQFLPQYTGNSNIEVNQQKDGVLISFLLTGLDKGIIPLRSFKKTEELVSSIVPVVDGARWEATVVSDTVMKFSQTREIDMRDDDEARTRIGKAALASLKFSGSYARVDDVALLAVDGLVPSIILVSFIDGDDMDTGTRTRFAQGLSRILHAQYGGKWKTEFDEDGAAISSRSDD